ncbi:RNA polymerase-associated protein RapA [Aestuariibacter sp. AA17]|uniref:RNA polymerase-associated protein RapA n=1 Tax=Fluctibacter corallii TaxID=2984329 RepID=A0ABT3A6Z3_9ALTE|nr:RNA polymerase-associated protein RapA [Aestuariibacter sp. AA17]MCV2884459.1 RNA polymerase-associated protein RapA [Aestuariibacter sp. AA17]
MSGNHEIALGQRWLSTTETELGLGTIVGVDERSVNILFPATGESRNYARRSAPLSRITFDIGESVKCHEGWSLVVDSVSEEKGLLSYTGSRLDTKDVVTLKETFIDHNFQLAQPEKRLLAGQIDHPKWFGLREACFTHQYAHATSSMLGFVGARVDLIPHQLHIAAEVGRRYAPRVLLADEVGLGKTIEAALIIHQQLLTGRAQRVLIVVPSSLVHQWLVEMLRRVNLAFSIFDEARCQAMAGEAGNPFEDEQLVLCSLDFLTHNSQYYQQAMDASWDLMVVDEAHHLTWSEGQPSQEYTVVEGLANATKGVLLLTATPDQLGHESHFARLRLLDPARFHDYQAFVAEEKHYSELASAIEPLLAGDTLSDTHIQAISHFAGDEMPEDINSLADEAKDALIHTLLDRHGTGRVLFRNSRAGIEGFPTRHLHTYPLPMPSTFSDEIYEETPLELRLAPERMPEFVENWTQFDPRVDWLIEKLDMLKGEKVLMICSKAHTALQLSEALRVKSGIRASVFHEGMSIVERDKAANYFAQSEDGAQVLICSEIGSEGRNFQFAHHLIFFDLPMVPDLLEQRIGRLDRIGQTENIQIHVPFFHDTAQEVLLNWYHRGLNAFEQTCPTGLTVFEETCEELFMALLAPKHHEAVEALIQKTAGLHAELKAQLESGRDKLLELNSSGKGRVEGFLSEILDAEQSPTLERFMTRLFDVVGVLQEEKDDSCYLLRPTESMHTQLPGLDEEGMTITYERSTATAMEHVHFFSWDHPMVHHAMDMILTDVVGKSAIGLVSDKTLPAGIFWVECLFTVSGKGQKQLQLPRFLPATPVRVCIDAKGQETDRTFEYLKKVNNKIAQQLTGALRGQIEQALTVADSMAKTKADSIKEAARERMQASLGAELTRLQELKKVNPSVREEEITFLTNQIDGLQSCINDATVVLEAVRLVVNNP